jgi:NADPH:quinone reductase-like Zn-dependent oxidoreductase
MKAIVLNELGGPRKLSLEDVPEPEPAVGEVVITLAAAALNRRDLFITHGLYPGIVLPGILGADGTGVVSARGEGVGHVPDGDVVILPSLGWGDNPRAPLASFSILGVPKPGTFAEQAAVPAENVFAKPAHLTTGEAASLPLGGVTAYRALVTKGEVAPGERVLVTGVGGGVATLCVQFAAALGAEVWVTSGSTEKVGKAKALGATGGLATSAEDYSAQLKALSGSFDLVVDSIGGRWFRDYVRLTKQGGRIVTFGATAGPVPELVMPTLFLKHVDILGTAMGNADDFRGLLDLVARHEIRPLIAARFPLAQTVEALELMEAGTAMGKILIEIR